MEGIQKCECGFEGLNIIRHTVEVIKIDINMVVYIVECPQCADNYSFIFHLDDIMKD